MESKKFFLSVFLFLFCLAEFAFAGPKKYLVGVENIEYHPHFSYDREKKKYSGFFREVMDRFGKEQGYTFVYQAFPVNRLFRELVTGSIDFKYPDHVEWGLKSKGDREILYSLPVVEYAEGIMLYPKFKGVGIGRIRRLGTILGFGIWDNLDGVREGRIRLIKSTNIKSLLKLILAERIDGVIVNVAIARYQLGKSVSDPDKLVFDPSLPHRIGYYHLSSIKHPEIMKEFDLFLVKRKPWIDQLKKNYGLLLPGLGK